MRREICAQGKAYNKCISAAALALSALCLGGTAHAQTVSFTISEWQQQFPGSVTPPHSAPHVTDGAGYAGDTVAFASYSGTLNLAVGTFTQSVSPLSWNIDYTYGGTATSSAQTDWSNQTFNITAARTISFANGPSGSLLQTGTVLSTWDNDYLTFNSGTTASFAVQGYQVDVTLLGLSQPITGGDLGQQAPQAMSATFVVTAVPEPETYAMLLAGLALIGVMSKRRDGKPVAEVGPPLS